MCWSRNPWDWGSKVSPCPGAGGRPGLNSGYLAVNPGSCCGSHRLPQGLEPWGLRPGSPGALLHGQEGASRTQIPRHHPDLLMWAEPRRLHVDDLLLGESGTHFLWVMPVRPCQDSYLAPEHSRSLTRSMPSPWLTPDGMGEWLQLHSLYWKFQLLWGQLCPLPGRNQLKQQTCLFLPLNRKCVPYGRGQGTKDTFGASAGSAAIHSLHPRLCVVGPYTCTPPHTSRGRGPGNWQYILIGSFVFWNPWPCHLSLTPTQSVLACLTWTKSARGDWHLSRSSACWRDDAQSSPLLSSLSISPGTTYVYTLAQNQGRCHITLAALKLVITPSGTSSSFTPPASRLCTELPLFLQW